MSKKEVSNILQQPERSWIKIDPEVSYHIPKHDVPVIIRLVDRSQPVMEDENGITYLEDLKIARLKSSIEGNRWVIEGPFPIYDYSPLTHFDALKPNTTVTHWAGCGEKELEYWKHRFDVRGDFTHLELKVDDDHKELVYRSLMHASIYMRYAVAHTHDKTEQGKLNAMLNALYDLQSVMDCGGLFQKSVEGDNGVISTEGE